MSTTNQVAISAEGLVKKYGSTTALDGVDLTVPAGTVLGVLGPNGAGKTTAVRILGTLLQPDAGHATVGGYDVVREAPRVREIIGLTGQYASVDEDMSGRRNLVMIGRLLGMPRAQAKVPRRRTAGTLRADRCRGPDRQDVLRRHAPAARPGREPGRPPEHPLPGRADHRTRPARPQRRLGHRPQPGARRYDGAADHAVPGGGRRAGRLDHGVRQGPGGRRRAAGRAQGRRRASSRSTSARPNRVTSSGSPRSSPKSVGTRPTVDVVNALVSVPVFDGTSMPVVVRRLDEAGIAVTELSLRLPSLDEVFLALTGHAAEEQDTAVLEGAGR